MIWELEVVGEERNPTTLLRILDFLFTANDQCKNQLDLSAFVGSKPHHHCHQQLSLLWPGGAEDHFSA